MALGLLALQLHVRDTGLRDGEWVKVEVGDEIEDEDAVGVFWRNVAMGHVAKDGVGGGVG